MSLIFLVAFILKFFAGNTLKPEYLIVWALFAIADSLWYDKIKWKDDKDCQE